MKAIAGLCALCIQLPIWYFLMYKILTIINATELMWFLYWIYVPIGILVQTIIELTRQK